MGNLVWCPCPASVSVRYQAGSSAAHHPKHLSTADSFGLRECPDRVSIEGSKPAVNMRILCGVNHEASTAIFQSVSAIPNEARISAEIFDSAI
jgi:hypothetical protein